MFCLRSSSNESPLHFRHYRESGNPVFLVVAGFRLALAIASLAGMTARLGILTVYFNIPLWLCAIILLVSCSSASAQENIRVVYPSAAVNFVPLWAAKEAGFFKKNNLPIELVSIRSSPVAMAALLSGDVDVIVGGANPGITLQLQGYKDITLFGGLINTFLFSICSVPAIEDVSQLKGRRLGVTRFGGSNDFAGRYFLRQKGLDPNKDLTLIQVGAQEDLL